MPGSVTSAVLFRARYGEGDDTAYRQIYADGNLGWDGLARHLTAVDVEGGHSSMLQEPDVKSLAEALVPLTSPESGNGDAGARGRRLGRLRQNDDFQSYLPHRHLISFSEPRWVEGL